MRRYCVNFFSSTYKLKQSVGSYALPRLAAFTWGCEKGQMCAVENWYRVAGEVKKGKSALKRFTDESPAPISAEYSTILSHTLEKVLMCKYQKTL